MPPAHPVLANVQVNLMTNVPPDTAPHEAHATDSPAGRLTLSGGELCLDFANSVGSRHTDHEHDYLEEYADLVAWSEHTGSIDSVEARDLDARAGGEPAAAAIVLARARALREAIYHIFDAQARAALPAAADLDLLNRELAAALAQLRLQPHADHFDWTWATGSALERPLWPIARSAADLLTSGELGRVHKCANDGCHWLFVDRSKNHSRRWCDMKECGNVAKVRRYRTRHKE